MIEQTVLLILTLLVVVQINRVVSGNTERKKPEIQNRKVTSEQSMLTVKI